MAGGEKSAPPSIRSLAKKRQAENRGPRWLWAILAAPGAVWLLALFVLPFFVVLAVAAGKLDPIFRSPIPVWNPLQWSSANFTLAWQDLVGNGAYIGPPLLRTVVYTAIASLICLVICLPGRVFRHEVRGQAKDTLLGPVNRSFLGELHDEDARVDRPPFTRRVRGPGPRRSAHHVPAGGLARW